MEWITTIIQLIIALSIYNVWLLRFSKPTGWRGGTAKSMKEEFEVYGLPDWFMKIVGALKLILATLLIVGVWVSGLVIPAALGVAILMLGAIIMHFKVKDAPLKSLPAFTFLVFSLILIFF